MVQGVGRHRPGQCLGPFDGVARKRSDVAPPYADGVNGLRHSSIKELRVQSKGEPIRAFFAFDPKRNRIVLCAGNKTGDKRFYDVMIPIADAEFSAHLESLN